MHFLFTMITKVAYECSAIILIKWWSENTRTQGSVHVILVHSMDNIWLILQPISPPSPPLSPTPSQKQITSTSKIHNRYTEHALGMIRITGWCNWNFNVGVVTYCGISSGDVPRRIRERKKKNKKEKNSKNHVSANTIVSFPFIR